MHMIWPIAMPIRIHIRMHTIKILCMQRSLCTTAIVVLYCALSPTISQTVVHVPARVHSHYYDMYYAHSAYGCAHDADIDSHRYA